MAEHSASADGQALLQSPRASAATRSFSRTTLSLSIYLSCSLLTIWDRGAHVSVDLCVCARCLASSQFSPRRFQSNNAGGKLERFNSHARERERESNETDGRYGQLWYAVPSVFAGMAGISSTSSGSGYKGSTRSWQCSFTRVLSLFRV